MEMTETSEEEESEKRWDEDEMNGYDEETIRDETDKSWDGLEEGIPEGNVEEEVKNEQEEKGPKTKIE